MNANINLKQTERNTFKLATYTDGINDIALGLVMVLMGIYPFTRKLLGVTGNMIFSLAVLGFIFLGQVLTQKHLLPSRAGVVKFGKRIQDRLKIAVFVGLVLFILTMGTWYLTTRGYELSPPTWLGNFGVDILVSVIPLLIFCGIAYTLELPRYYLYGVLLGASLLTQPHLSVYQGWPFLISAVVMISIGSVLLTRFLKQYPASNRTMGER